MARPISTYRVQLNGAFTFTAAAAIVPYLDRLGISDCYCSPYLKANPGSRHGYDICDHGALNPELGSADDYRAFCEALRQRGLGHIVDFVPNHMAADAKSNAWWRDVLENGPSSPYATYFDIDWDPVKPELKDKILLPVLGDQYGRVLERGELQLRFEDGALHLGHWQRDLPINPRQSPRVLGLHLQRLENAVAEPVLREYLSILTALRNLPAYTERDRARVVERHREKEVARARLARLAGESAAIRDHIDTCVREANGVPGDPASFHVLHELLEQQAYRLAYWRTAFDEINYRRFFDINELVGLRIEEPVVFDAAHGLLTALVRTGDVTGIRIDHPDGLFDPEAYFARLREIGETDGGARAAPDAEDGVLYVVAEKILSDGEALRPEWAVSGTTGYGFLNLVGGLFIQRQHTRELHRVYARVTGRRDTFEEVAYDSKSTIMLTALASELNVLAHALNRISEGDRRLRDFTLESCRKVLREVIACFPVYRTYVSERGASTFDRAAIDSAIADARRRNPLMEASIFEFLREVLQSPADEGSTMDRRQFAMRFQQFTGPVQAKGVEDTAFYRYHVLVSANDVGGHPGRLGVSAEEFHAANRERLARWPLEMITTATHDTKRGEDARMRISVLSELPDQWRSAVSEWMRLNARHRSRIGAAWAPDRNDEYLFYQTLIGVWPAEPSEAPLPSSAPSDLAQRVSAYLQKAAREAKVHTSWIDENQAYGRAAARFAENALTGRGSAPFLASFLRFQRRIARLGMVNSLAQLVLKIASPGVPDFYQGNELWDLNLVDPDNRRPVDFADRERQLETLWPVIEAIENGRTGGPALHHLVERWEDGRIKMFLTACGLRFRRAHADVLLRGEYVSLDADELGAGHLVAFGRRHRTGTLIAAVPRFCASLLGDARRPPLGDEVWERARLLIPESLSPRRYRHLFSGEVVEAAAEPSGRSLRLSDLFRVCPVALLWAGD